MATAIKERPILFSGEMVRAILDGRKTQTRRVVKPQLEHGYSSCHYVDSGWAGQTATGGCLCSRSRVSNPWGFPGDRLWVRESCYQMPDVTSRDLCEGADTWPTWVYAADGDVEFAKAKGYRSRPSIHMPRWASRLTLEVTEVRVERLQDISLDDLKAEGITIPGPYAVGPEVFDGPDVDPWSVWISLWDSINVKKHSWSRNPWVWVVTFKPSINEAY